MNKYLILVLINLPLLLVGIVGAIADYKAAKTISKKKCIAIIVMWLAIGVGLVFAEPLYNVLIRNNLTDSAPMSIFDIVLLTMLIFGLLLIVKLNESLSLLNRKFARLHEQLAIVEAERRSKD